MITQEPDGRSSKRRKLDDGNFNFQKHPVTTAEQISVWTKFQQSLDPSVKAGLATFEQYLVSIARLADSAQRISQYRILKEYCQWQTAASDERLNFSDLLSTWSFAVDNGDDDVLSAVPAVLAQLLATISNNIDLRSFGLSLIISLLRRDQSRLFHKCLALPGSKPHLAIPCLHLLTQVVMFDAGAKAIDFWYRRDLVMPKIEAILDSREDNDGSKDQRNPSVRRAALHLVIAMLKFSDATTKTELLLQGRVLHSCLRGLSDDNEDIIIETVWGLENYIVNDTEIPRSAVIRFFNAPHLESIAALNKSKHQTDADDVQSAAGRAAHKLLQKLCTSKEGISLPQNGWFPPVSKNNVSAAAEKDYIDLGLDSPFYFDEYKDNIPVVNTVLSTFIARLKPHQDPLHLTLLLDVFRSSPELVAEYLSKRKQIPAANSDDTAWRGHFGLLFSVVELDPPHNLGKSDNQPKSPPPLSIVVESILPRPLDRSYLAKMLSSEDNILVISAARLITLALRKLQKVLTLFTVFFASDGYLWEQAAHRLSNLVESRIPNIREVTLALQHAKSDTNLRQVLLESLLAYHRTLPTISDSAPFDFGPFVSELCLSFKQDTNNRDAYLEQLVSCCQIAEVSSSTKWLHKSDVDSHSSLTHLVSVVVQLEASIAKQALVGIAQVAFRDRGIVCSASSFAALCSSFEESKKFHPSEALYQFFDNCLARACLRPVKYLDEVEKAVQLVSDKREVSLLVGAIAEQWTFAMKRYQRQKDIIRNLASWVARLFAFLDASGENYRVLAFFQDQMLQDSAGKAKEYLQKMFERIRERPLKVDTAFETDSHDAQDVLETTTAIASSVYAGEISFVENANGAIAIPLTVEGLDKWPADFDFELEFATQRLQRLLLCISSLDTEIRLQAQQLLQQITHFVDTESTHEAKQQLFLVLGEVCETTLRWSIREKPCPTLIPELANSLLNILLHPRSVMFGKANQFLLHKPYWSPKGALMYWMEHILCVEPDVSVDSQNVWNGEREWLLQLLLLSLRGEEDMDLYRRCNVWEEIMSLYATPCLSGLNRELILSLIHQGLRIPNGANMLWTRFGLQSWLVTIESSGVAAEDLLQLINQRLEQDCDQLMIEDWKIGCAVSRRKADGSFDGLDHT